MVHPQAFFLPIGTGQRFCLYYPAVATPARGAVVLAPAFGEELNKSRRMTAVQARSLAAHGLHVLQLDLLGCGDSSGDFSEARWNAWVDDLLSACEWLRQRSDAPLWLWGMRAGCLLAAEVAGRLDTASRLVLWAPVVSGRTVVQQLLRTAAAADLSSGNAKFTMDALRRRLALGENVEIAGYQTSAALLNALEGAALQPSVQCGHMLWFDVSTMADAGPSPAATKNIQSWRDAGCVVDYRAIEGPAFWQTTEIEEAPALVDATTQTMLQIIAQADRHA